MACMPNELKKYQLIAMVLVLKRLFHSGIAPFLYDNETLISGKADLKDVKSSESKTARSYGPELEKCHHGSGGSSDNRWSSKSLR